MHGTVRSASLALALTLAIPGAALGQAPDGPSPFNGSWKLDSAASKFRSGPAMREETRTYEVSGDKVKMTAKGVNGSGKPVNYHYSAAYDGKFYPMVGNPVVDSISMKRLDARTIESTVKKGEAVYAHAKLAVSADGRRLSMTREVMQANATPVVDELAFVKQR